MSDIVEELANILRKQQNCHATFYADAQDLIKALAAANLVIEQGWRTIDEAPRDGTEVDLYGVFEGEGFMTYGAYSEHYGGFMRGKTTVGHSYLTHYKPRPTAPEVG